MAKPDKLFWRFLNFGHPHDIFSKNLKKDLFGAQKLKISQNSKIAKKHYPALPITVILSYQRAKSGEKWRWSIFSQKKFSQKSWFEIANISWNPQKSFLDPEIHIFDPRTPKFGILVQNGVTIHIFLEFLRNVENWPFFRFLTIFGIFGFSRAAGSAKVR